MNLRLALVLATILVVLIFSWGLLLWHWKTTLDEAQLRLRQSLVRKWSAVIVFIIFAGATAYWLALALAWVAPGPGFALFPLAAIVCLIGGVAVRGLWYFTLPSGKLPWLNTVAYRVTLLTAIIGVVTIVTIYVFSGVPRAVAFSEQSIQRATDFFQIFVFLILMVGAGELFLQRILPNPEDMKSDEADGAGDAAGVERPHSVLMLFDFPPPVRVICGQYLLYFEQFLRDVGVEVHTTISDQAGQLLFSVTPEDKNEALHNIRAALAIYLRLPLSPIGDTTHESIAAQRLEANLMQLNSQLRLASAEIQLKNAEIQAQDTTIENQRRMIAFQKRFLSGEVVVDSLKEMKPKPEDPEDLIPGIITLKPLLVKGVQINLGEILRRVKSLFADKEEPNSQLDDSKLLKQ